jgi:glycyl-tRNA synthetase beta chain
LGLEFLLEIGCEELPAPVIRPSLEQLELRFHEFLSHNTLSSERIESYGTPRRLIVCIKNLSPSQPDQADTILGPAYSVAFTPEGNPSKAAEGFARKYQLKVEDLKCLESDKGRYLGFERTIPGRNASELLQASIPQIIRCLEFPKNMRWDASQFLFARPIRWLVCMLDGEVLDVTLAGVTSSDVTFGHRVLTRNSKIQVKSFEEFKLKLLNYKVHFEQRERLNRIETQLDRLSSLQNAKTVKDSELLDIVTYLNEYPSVICGGFDPVYLRLPREVLITVMRQHQKYFSLQNEQGALLPKFLAVVDSDESNHETITLGHERVLKARLADASFFWDIDR